MTTTENTQTTPAKKPTSRKPVSRKPATKPKPTTKPKPAVKPAATKPKPTAKPAGPGTSTMTRVALTPAEWTKLRKLSKTSGVTLARIIGDAVRAHVLTPAGTGK